MLFLTGSSFYLIIRFPFYTRFKVVFVIFFVINTLLFIRFKDPRTNMLQRIMSSKFFPRKLSITMEGKYLIFITIGIGIAAINTGVNLLYLLMTMLLSLMVASGILSELTLRKIRWELELPNEAKVSFETVATLIIKNTKKRLSSFSLEGELITPEGNGIIQKKGSVLKLKAGEASRMHIKTTFPNRGRQNIIGVSIGTRFPFSFFNKSRYFLFNRSVLVLPKDNVIVAHIITDLLQAYNQDIESQINKGYGLEFHSVRQMIPGDDWRNIHWKKTAAKQEFMIKEFDSTLGQKASLCLTGEKISKIDYDIREKGIEIVASIARQLVSRNFKVGLMGPSLNLPEESGQGSLKKILVALALLNSKQDFYAASMLRLKPLPIISIWINLDNLKVSQGGRELGMF